jgi:UDP-N-acetylglucosamine 2-epimerase (non-hydrolysing)
VKGVKRIAMKHIGIFVGTRPEAIKLIPVYKTIKADKTFAVSLISTGQHKEMLNQVFTFFSIVPDINLALMTTNQTLTELTSKLLIEVDKVINLLKLDMVLVQGDTTTCMAASLAAFYNKINIGHVEAGLRTHNKYAPFPEEINRKITGVLADIHFAPTVRASEALLQENIRTNVYVTGNSVIDSLIHTREIVTAKSALYSTRFPFLHHYDKVVLVTGHRRENFGEGFRNICEALGILADQYKSFAFVYPVHLNPNVREIVFEKLGSKSNMHLIDPLGYDDIVYLMSKSYIILTDSGGIQEEAPTLGIPVLVLRSTTERPEAVESNSSKLVGSDKQEIISSFIDLVENKETYKKMSSRINPYGDGKTAERILSLLKKYFSN